MIIRPLQDGDLEAVMANPKQKSLKRYPPIVNAPADTWVIEDKGKVVALGGIAVFWEGVGEAWMIVSGDISQDSMYGAELYRAMANKLEWIIRSKRLWRVEAHARVDFPTAVRFLTLLGFERQCIREKFAPDAQDVILFAKVFDEYIPDNYRG